MSFYRPELGGIIVENVDVDGNLVDCFEGRQVTPGHAIEAMWFIMDLGQKAEPTGAHTTSNVNHLNNA